MALKGLSAPKWIPRKVFSQDHTQRDSKKLLKLWLKEAKCTVSWQQNLEVLPEQYWFCRYERHKSKELSKASKKITEARQLVAGLDSLKGGLERNLYEVGRAKQKL